MRAKWSASQPMLWPWRLQGHTDDFSMHIAIDCLFTKQLFRQAGLTNHRFERAWPYFVVHVVGSNRHAISRCVFVLTMAAVLPFQPELTPLKDLDEFTKRAF